MWLKIIFNQPTSALAKLKQNSNFHQRKYWRALLRTQISDGWITLKKRTSIWRYTYCEPQQLSCLFKNCQSTFKSEKKNNVTENLSLYTLINILKKCEISYIFAAKLHSSWSQKFIANVWDFNAFLNCCFCYGISYCNVLGYK